ncbi:MAG: DUF308 domain-containing protein [Lachnospiraceae bacterium]|nr:DUF308 domain-containing protein [Lachnospiraceae bacterium]
MDFLKSTAKREIFFAILYLALGIFFVMMPGLAFITIGRVFSIAILIIGIISICNYFSEKNFIGEQKNGLTYGLVLSILAIYFMIRPDFISTLIGVIIGFMIIVAGITQLQNAIDLLHFKEKNWLFMLISSGILIILGIISLINPFDTDRTLIFATGVFIIISAAVKLISTFMLLMGARSVKKADSDDIVDAEEAVVTDADETSAENTEENAESKTEDKEEKKDEAPVFNENI